MDIAKGTGMNVSVLNYDGRQYIIVYNTDKAGLAITEHKAP